jgi:hypothetical protein
MIKMYEDLIDILKGWTTQIFKEDECPLFGKITVTLEDGTYFGSGKGVIIYGDEYVRFNLDDYNINLPKQSVSENKTITITVNSIDIPKRFRFYFEPYSHPFKQIASYNAQPDTSLCFSLSESTNQMNCGLKPLPDKDGNIVSIITDIVKG